MDATDNPRLQEVLEQILAGRTRGLICPFCEKHELDEEGSAFGKRFACDGCGKYIEAPDEM